ncbi:Amidohydrolase family protein [Lactobacillus equicursoris 66c]|uniref:Amidohydrolase family protein n=1 Tax=Lactobacillus equicursoris 66c TaxID=872326 RepID=K0NU25_9LACO|nr:amidohydrolase [Lactobacillus equicursoris]CCK82700.1 Amidohydrolase family protein [Lactobacillus equicursoris 66c]
MHSKRFINGKIFLGTSETAFADSLTVVDGKIAPDNAVSEPDEVIDLHGATVVPGLIDNHTHPKYIADALHGAACTPPLVNSIPEMQEALRHTPEYGKGADVWIEGWGFDESKLAEHRSPNRDDLDQVSTTQPIFLYRSDCHSSVGNSRALELAGIDENTPDPAGGKIEKDENGRPTGFMREVAASQLLIRAKSALSYENDVNNLVNSSEHYLENGIVAIGEMMGRLHPYASLKLYQDAYKAGFKPKSAIYYVADEVDGPLEIAQTDRLRVAGLKVFMDGSISGETAYMKAGFPSGKKGVCLTSQARLKEIIDYARANHLQVAVHAMGDEAVQNVIDVCQDLDPWLDGMPSVRIEHASLISDQMFEQLKKAKIGLGISTQSIFFFAEEDSYRQFLSKNQLKLAYRIKTMEKEAPIVSLSSDAPCTPWAEPDSPFYGMYAAVTRKTAGGGTINADEAISLPQALLAYTRDAAIMGGFTQNGTLEAGKDADFVVLNKDLFSQKADDLTAVHADQTWIGGELVYQRK